MADDRQRPNEDRAARTRPRHDRESGVNLSEEDADLLHDILTRERDRKEAREQARKNRTQAIGQIIVTLVCALLLNLAVGAWEWLKRWLHL